MRIGVDARLLTEPVMGIGRYTDEMVRSLQRHEADFVLYTPSPPLERNYGAANVRVRAASAYGRFGRMLWSQTTLPYWAGQDVVDLYWGTTHRLPRYLPDRIARVVTIHDLVWKQAGETMRPFSRFMEKHLMPQAIRLADRIIADSASTAGDIEAVFPSARGKVRVVHLAASAMPDPLPFHALQALAIDRPYFLFVGTLEPRKNLQRLLQAYAGLPVWVRARFQLVIAGGKGWGGVDVEETSRKLGLAGDVRVTGLVTDAQLATLYAHARFLAMPSIYEGFGLPVLEAMSYGVPALTSNTSSLPEVAGDAAVLVDPLDVSSITKGLMRLLTEDDLHASLAKRAKPQASQYSWDKAASEAMVVFQEAVNERRLRMQGR